MSTTAQSLTDWEIEVLKSLAGWPSQVTGWGAAFSAGIEYLRSAGLCDRQGVITEKGRQLLASIDAMMEEGK